MVYLFYTTYISVDLAHHEIFHAKVGKGGIMLNTSRLWCLTVSLSLSHWYPGSGVVLDCIDS